MRHSSELSRSLESSKKKASSVWDRAAAEMNMSSRIIRADRPNVKISPSGTAIGGHIPEGHLMDVEKQAFEQGYSEGERMGKQMGEAMIESVCKRYEKSI